MGRLPSHTDQTSRYSNKRLNNNDQLMMEFTRNYTLSQNFETFYNTQKSG